MKHQLGINKKKNGGSKPLRKSWFSVHDNNHAAYLRFGHNSSMPSTEQIYAGRTYDDDDRTVTLNFRKAGERRPGDIKVRSRKGKGNFYRYCYPFTQKDMAFEVDPEFNPGDISVTRINESTVQFELPDGIKTAHDNKVMPLRQRK